METGASTGLAASLQAAHIVPVEKPAKPHLKVKEAANEPGKPGSAEQTAPPPKSGINNKAEPALNSATAIALQSLASQEKINPESQRQQFAFKRPEKELTPTELAERDEKARQAVPPGFAKSAVNAFTKAQQLKPGQSKDGETTGIAIFGPNGSHPNAERASIVNITV